MESTKNNLVKNVIEVFSSFDQAVNRAGGSGSLNNIIHLTLEQMISIMAKNDIRFRYVGEQGRIEDA